MQTPTQAMRLGPLSHIRVLDLTIRHAEPDVVQILGDFGAQIINLRAADARYDNDRPKPRTGHVGLSIVVDLKTPDGVQIVKDLADECDILIENSDSGAMKRLGLAYEDLEPGRPGLIYCSMPDGDAGSAMKCAIAALAALAQRTETGLGAHLTGDAGGAYSAVRHDRDATSHGNIGTRDFLHEVLGYDEDKIEALIHSGVIVEKGLAKDGE